MKQGIYEKVISRELSEKLNELKVTKVNIDVEEARTVIFKYVSEVTRRTLSYLRVRV